MALSELGFLLHLEVCLVPLTNTVSSNRTEARSIAQENAIP